MSLSRVWFGVRIGTWLLWLPIALHVRALPRLLEQASRAGRSRGRAKEIALPRALAIVSRISRLRLFELPLFPKACLRRSLALYHALPLLGHDPEIHFGVRKDRTRLHAHSWVTLAGRPLGETEPQDAFQKIFSYPGVERAQASFRRRTDNQLRSGKESE